MKKHYKGTLSFIYYSYFLLMCLPLTGYTLHMFGAGKIVSFGFMFNISSAFAITSDSVHIILILMLMALHLRGGSHH